MIFFPPILSSSDSENTDCCAVGFKKYFNDSILCNSVCMCVCVRLQIPPSFIGSGNICEDIFLFLGSWSHRPHLQGGHHPKCTTEAEVTQKGVNYGTEVKDPKGKRRDAPRADLEAPVPAFGHKRIWLITGAFASLWNWQQAFCKNRMN